MPSTGRDKVEVLQHLPDCAQDVLSQWWPLCCCVLGQQAEGSVCQKTEQTDLQDQ